MILFTYWEDISTIYIKFFYDFYCEKMHRKAYKTEIYSIVNNYTTNYHKIITRINKVSITAEVPIPPKFAFLDPLDLFGGKHCSDIYSSHSLAFLFSSCMCFMSSFMCYRQGKKKGSPGAQAGDLWIWDSESLKCWCLCLEKAQGCWLMELWRTYELESVIASGTISELLGSSWRGKRQKGRTVSFLSPSASRKPLAPLVTQLIVR